MKVTLIYPGIGIIGFNSPDLSGEKKWINHGLALIGANLKKHGHEVDLIDMRDLQDWNHFIFEIKKRNPDFIGIGISYLDWKIADKCFQIIKEINPEIKTIAGGIFPSIFPDEVLKNKYIDYVIQGEGEIAMLDIINGNGIDFDRFIISEPIHNLDLLPFSDRELFDYRKELSQDFSPSGRTPHITMISGRGCPYGCGYCQPAERMVFKGKYRMRSVPNVIQELIELRRYNFQSITFWDDTFTANHDWVMEFCDAYKIAGFGQKIACCSRADIICNNESMIKRMSEIGVEYFVVGFETGTDRLLKFINKGVMLEQNYRAVEICRKYGIKVFGTFMLGLPTETKEESRATIDMIKKIQPNHGMVFYFNPIPGTHLFDYCAENKLILRDDPFNIERTSQYSPKIKGIDYEYLNKLQRGEI